MNIFLETHAKKYGVVNTVLTDQDYQTIINSYQEFAAEKGLFISDYAKFKTAYQKTAEKISGMYKDKETILIAIADMAEEICLKTRAKALRNDNKDIYDNVNYTRSVILNMNEEVVINTCKVIKTTTEEAITLWGNFGISQQQLNDLLTKVNEYEKKINDINAAEDQTKGDEYLYKIIDSIELTLKIMKDYSVHYKKNEGKFYRLFRNALVLEDFPHKITSIWLTMVDVDNNPLHDVSVEITISDKKVVRKTTVKGGVRFIDLPEDEYTIYIYRNDLVAKTVTIRTIPKEMIRQTIVLEKI